MSFCPECGTNISGEFCASCGIAYEGGYDYYEGGYGGGYKDGYEGDYEGTYKSNVQTPSPSIPISKTPSRGISPSYSAPISKAPTYTGATSNSYASSSNIDSSDSHQKQSSPISTSSKSASKSSKSVIGKLSKVKGKMNDKVTDYKEQNENDRSYSTSTTGGVRTPTKSVYMVSEPQRNTDSPVLLEGATTPKSAGHALVKTFQDKNFKRLTKKMPKWNAQEVLNQAKEDYIGVDSKSKEGNSGGGYKVVSRGGGRGGGDSTMKSTGPVVKKGKVLFNWEAENDIELPVMKVGDIVEIIEDDDSEWFMVSLKGKEGFVPRSYIAVLKSAPASSAKSAESVYIQNQRRQKNRERKRTIIQGDPHDGKGVYFRVMECFNTKVGKDKYICYAVKCKWAGVEWTIFRRYSQFYEFSLKARRVGIKFAHPFPGKVAFKNKQNMKEREEKLRLWVFGLSETADQWIKVEKRKKTVSRFFGPTQLGDTKTHSQMTLPFDITIGK